MYSHFCKRAVRARSVNSFDSKSALNARAKEAKFVSSMSNTPKKNKDRKYSSVLFEREMRVFLFARVVWKAFKRVSVCVCVWKLQLSFCDIFLLRLGFKVWEKNRGFSQKKPANFSSKVEPPLLRVALGNKESITPTTTVERKARVSIKRIIYNAHEEARRKLLLL